MKQYISLGIIYLVRAIPLAVIVYVSLLAVLWASKKRRSLHLKLVIREFIFSLYMITVLEITGIVGMSFRADWFINSFHSIGFYFPQSAGELSMAIFNAVLFIPLGVLLPVVFQRAKLSWKKILAIGFGISAGIELLQMFGGRMSELNDICCNLLGTVVGYVFFICVRALYSRSAPHDETPTDALYLTRLTKRGK